MRNGKKQAFTLMEMLVVVALIGILVGLMVPVIQKGLQSAKRNQARNDLRDIRAAVHAYYQEYGKLPIPDDQQNCGDAAEYNPEEDASRWIMVVLGGNPDANWQGNPEPGPIVQRHNPKGMTFLSGLTNTLTGHFEDPWGIQYALKLDCNYNGRVEYYSGGQTEENIPDIVVAVSYGPDRTKCSQQDLGDCDDLVSFNFKETAED